ncbi:MAG TPA: hypothetical protein VM492_04095 [Sumerlaeia bacterium]|nr:hypothetical protein [Sumerlaeia bacterium]
MRPGLALSLLLALLYLLTFGGHIYSPDGEILFRTAEALATRGSLAIEPMAGFATQPGRREDGREYAQYGVGQPLAATPFYWLGRALRPLAPDRDWVALRSRLRTAFPPLSVREPGSEEAGDRRLAEATAGRLGVSLFNLATTALSGLVLFLLIHRLTGATHPAWVATLIWGAGSMAWPHARTFFTEPLAGLCLLLSLGTLARYFLPEAPPRLSGGQAQAPSAGREDFPPGGRPQFSRCGAQGLGCPSLPVLSGLALGFGCLVRLDSVVFLPGLAALVAWGDFRRPLAPGQDAGPDSAETRMENRILAPALRHVFRLRVLGRLARFALPVAAAGGVILALNVWRFGHLLDTGYGDQPEGIAFTTPLLAGLYGFLMSVGKGMFFFSPPLVLAFWGLRPMLRRLPLFGGCLILIFLSFLCFQSCWRNWAGGWCWGPRHIMQIHALLAVPIGFWIAERWNAVRRVTLICLLIVGVAIQVYGCSQSFMDFYAIFYRDPDPPNAYVLYDMQGNPTLDQRYLVFIRDPIDGRPIQRISPAFLPAPINDSIYIAQNSQWPGYARLWRELGIHDFFWLHLFDV